MNEMKTDHEINEAIAVKCGWTKNRAGWWKHSSYPEAFFPDYCSDLNAMSEAEKIVDREFYVAQLLAVIHEVDADYFNKITWENGYELTTATAHQRAVAFCRTVGIKID